MPELTYSIDDLLGQMVARGASDLHVTIGTPPTIRVRGHLERLEGYEPLVAEDTMQLFYRIMSTEQQKRLEIERQIDVAHHVPGVARFRVNIFFQRDCVGRLVPPDPSSDPDPRGARPAGEPARARRPAARAGARDRADRLRQVDDARVADRRDQPHPAGAHPHDRGPDRVRARARELHRQPARDRHRRRELRRGAARSAARGPRRDPARRDARPRDDRDRADRGRDRPPRVRHPAHAERRRRRSTASSTSSRPSSRTRSGSSSQTRSKES